MLKRPDHLRTILTIAAMATFGCAMAQSQPSITAIHDMSLPARKAWTEICTSNPAAMVYLDTLSLSRIGLSGRLDAQSEAVIQQLGKGGYEFSAGAESYLRLNSMSVAWGSASFAAEQTNDVKWADCIDYLRIAPYVLGDGIGGDLSSRKYTFAGGYGTHLGRWSIGAQADYRAEIAYRDHDPRLKTIVSNLAVNLGATYRLNKRYVIGLDVSIDIYRQDCDLDFYNPINDINTYPLTGLGTYYKRFVGNANKNAGYQSEGYSCGVQLISTECDGFNASTQFAHSRVEQRLRSYNNLTLAYCDNISFVFNMAYIRQLSAYTRLTPWIKATYHTRKGIENLFGTASGASYDIIGSRENYIQSHRSATIGIPVEIALGSSRLTAIPQLSATNTRARIVDIVRKYYVSSLIPALGIDYSLTTRNLIVNAGAAIDYSLKKAPSEKNNIAQQAATIDIEGLGECVIRNYDILKANRVGIGISAGVGKMIHNLLFSIKLNYKYHNYADPHVRSHYATVFFGTTF